MKQEQNAQDDGNRVESGQPKREMRPVTIISIGIIAFVLIIGFWWIFLGDHIHDDAKRAEVWVQSLLSTAIFIVVAIQACIYFRQAKALDRQVRHSARQTKSSNKLATTALKQFEITDRPWLAFDVELTSPLTFTDQNMQLGFKLTAKNVGRSVAVNATINSKIVIPRLGPDCNVWAEVLTAQQNLCQNIHSRFMSYPIFPDEVYNLGQGFALGLPEVEKGRLPGTNFMQIYLVGCVDYQFAGHDTRHQTGFTCEIHETHPDNPNITLGLEIGKDVPLERLKLMRMFIGGGDYAT